MAVQITRRRIRSGGAAPAALSTLALTGGFAGAVTVPVGLAVELGDSAVFVSAWSAMLKTRYLLQVGLYKYFHKTFFYILWDHDCQGDLPMPRKAIGPQRPRPTVQPDRQILQTHENRGHG